VLSQLPASRGWSFSSICVEFNDWRYGNTTVSNQKPEF
jgi:hypothetical protein